MKTISKNWRIEPFTKVITDMTGGNPKVQQKDYLSSGLLPVIDQGQKEIAGYVNDLDLRCKAPIPCIVFGDHTKVLKYLDKPFAIGADGTKILVTSNELNPKYAFYYLQQIHLPENLGYSRHFKFLKECLIPLPSLSEQKRISAILDKADAVRRKRQETIRLLDEFLRSAFLEMFGDPVRNEKCFPIVRIDDISSHVSSGSTPLGGKSTYLSTGVLFIRSQNVHMNKLSYDDIAYISEDVHKSMQRSWVKNGDVLLNITGASIGRVAYYTGDDDTANVNQHVCIIRPIRDKIFPEYLSFFISQPTYQDLILSKNSGATRQAFTFEQIKKFNIFLPPISLQREFANIVEKTNQHKHLLEKSLAGMEESFNCIIQKAFRGEL